MTHVLVHLLIKACSPANTALGIKFEEFKLEIACSLNPSSSISFFFLSFLLGKQKKEIIWLSRMDGIVI